MAGFHCAINDVDAGAGAAWGGANPPVAASGLLKICGVTASRDGVVTTSMSSSAVICDEQSSSRGGSVLSGLSLADCGLCVTVKTTNKRRDVRTTHSLVVSILRPTTFVASPIPRDRDSRTMKLIVRESVSLLSVFSAI